MQSSRVGDFVLAYQNVNPNYLLIGGTISRLENRALNTLNYEALSL